MLLIWYLGSIKLSSDRQARIQEEDKQEEKQNICSLEQFKTWNCEEEVWASCCRSSDPGALRAMSLWESETPLNFITCNPFDGLLAVKTRKLTCE